MKASSILTLALAGAANAIQGFNIGAQTTDGTCKTQTNWQQNFQAMKNLGSVFTVARVYASSDCNTLANAVPAALATGVKLLVGVWTEDGTHYNNEKNALKAAVAAHGTSWIYAVSVGSEDLYRGDTTASTLASQIYDVRGMMGTIGGSGIPVGHVDTWTAWVNSANSAVIKACDFVGFDGYPYFQGSTIQNAKSVFDQSIQQTRQAIANAKPGTPLWITETGWPVSGPNYGAAVPSVANARSFWQNVWCTYPNANKFYYTLRDFNQSPSFGVLGTNFQTLFSLAC